MRAQYIPKRTMLIFLTMAPLFISSILCPKNNISQEQSVHKVYKDMYEFRQMISQLDPSMKYLKTMFSTTNSGISGMFMSKSIYAMLKQSVVWEFGNFPFDKVDSALKTKTVKSILAKFRHNLSSSSLFELWRELKRIQVVSDGKDHLSVRIISTNPRIIDIEDFPISCEESSDPCSKIPYYLLITKDLTMLVTILQEFIVMRTKSRIYPSRINRNNIITKESFRSDELLSTIDIISELPIKEMIESAFRAVELFSELLQVIQECSGLGVKEWLMKECLNEFPLAVYVVIVNTMKVLNDRPVPSKPDISTPELQ